MIGVCGWDEFWIAVVGVHSFDEAEIGSESWWRVVVEGPDARKKSKIWIKCETIIDI